MDSLRRQTLILLLAGGLLAGGCASQKPALRHYLLTPAGEVASAAEPGLAGQYIVVGPIQLPGYLDRPQLTFLRADGEVALREQHRWAEPLEAVLTRTLAENLTRLTGSERIFGFPAARTVNPDRRIIVRVLRFETEAGDVAVLRAQWSVVDGQGRTLLPMRIGEYRRQAADAGATAQVAALSATLEQFAREVALALRTAPSGP